MDSKWGMLTAVLSPLVNSFLFGMPSVTILPAILVKSVLLALVAGYMADRFRKITNSCIAGDCYGISGGGYLDRMGSCR